ncbi:MAG: histidinol-phosphate transaminase [Myxococcaceae bacterium]
MSSKKVVSAAIEGLPVYQAGRSIEEVSRDFGIEDIIKLASNENPFGPSPKAIAAMASALGSVSRYPDDGALELRTVLAARHGVGLGQVLLGAGGTDLIEVAVRTFTTPTDHALVSAGSFVAYRLFLMSASVPYAEVPLAGDSIDLPAIAAAVGPDTKLIFLPNPNNPTGTCFTAKELEAFLAAIPPTVVVVLDDAYVDYCEPGLNLPDTVALVRARPRTVVLRSFSKAYGLAGMRLGYAISSVELVDYMLKVRRPFSVSRLAIAAGRAAIDDREHVERTVRLTREGRAYLHQELTALGYRAVKSHANFVMVELGGADAVLTLVRSLLERGLIVRPLAPFGLPCALRITVGTERENRALIEALRALKEG